ncbi:MAG: hypothetical protein ACTHNZ_22965 [Trinickia sp.]|uniref:hypothetical protein n=1 Tax=Trinickia sp. TaxID=2571163 RepID=UPI003F8136A8
MFTAIFWATRLARAIAARVVFPHSMDLYAGINGLGSLVFPANASEIFEEGHDAIRTSPTDGIRMRGSLDSRQWKRAASPTRRPGRENRNPADGIASRRECAKRPIAEGIDEIRFRYRPTRQCGASQDSTVSAVNPARCIRIALVSLIGAIMPPWLAVLRTVVVHRLRCSAIELRNGRWPPEQRANPIKGTAEVSI